MLPSILIGITVACLIIAVTSFCSVIMCLHLRKRRRQAKQADEESTLDDFPATVRKLTIDRGNVVTAPCSPRLRSLSTRFSRLPMSIYAPTTRRNSTASTVVQEPNSQFNFTFKDIDVSMPSSPRSPMSSVSPTSTRPPRQTRSASQHRNPLVSMPEQAWLESISALSHPTTATTEAERVFSVKRAARRAKIPAENPETSVQLPERAVTSDTILNLAQHRKTSESSNSSGRKASLGAISQAIAEDSRPAPGNSSKYPSPPPPADQSSPVLNVEIPTPSVSMMNTPRSSVYRESSNGSRRSQNDRGRRTRPPPITITSSQQPPKVPETFLTSPTDTIATVRPNVWETRSRVEALRADIAEEKRKSFMSIASSQYSATFSIRPVDHIHLLQPVRAQQVLARGISSAELRQSAQQTAAATPTTALFPADYSLGKLPSHGASIACRMGPEEIAARISHAENDGSKHRPRLPELGNTATSPTTYHVPLTSASISFPPNLPDFSYSPTPGSPTYGPETFKPRQGSAPQPTMPRQITSPTLVSKYSESGLHKRAEAAALHHSATIDLAELPARERVRSPRSLNDVGSRGAATASISEMDKREAIKRARANVAARRQQRETSH